MNCVPLSVLRVTGIPGVTNILFSASVIFCDKVSFMISTSIYDSQLAHKCVRLCLAMELTDRQLHLPMEYLAILFSALALVWMALTQVDIHDSIYNISQHPLQCLATMSWKIVIRRNPPTNTQESTCLIPKLSWLAAQILM